MTENKRFKFIHNDVAVNLKTPILDNNIRMNIGEVLNKLNYQYETIQQLNSTNMELEDYCARLEEKNEQLKQIMQEVAKLLSEKVDVFSDKAIEHDINAYVELNELDNKDAYYMAKVTKTAIKLLKGDME